MRAWPSPDLPALPAPGPVVRVHATPAGGLVETTPAEPARLYVCGITPYDPMLERAEKVGIDWRELAEREIELFRQDMAALRVLPPSSFVGAVESMGLITDLIGRLQGAGVLYAVEDDLY